MYAVEFNYHDNIRKLQCFYDEPLREICKRYGRKAILDITTFHFLYLGKEINLDLNFSQLSNEIDKIRKVMTLNVIDRNMKDFNMVKAKEMICPECYDSVMFDVEKYKINVHDCKNGHAVGCLLLDEIEESQMIDFTQIKCDICRIYSRGYTYKNEFFRCNTCKMNLCPICELKPEKGHLIINYDRRNFVCDNHKRSYHSFCKDCKINMCVLCEKKHEKHKIIYLHKMLKYDKKELIEKLKKIKNIIDTFVRDVKEIISRLNLIKENMKSYYELNYNLIHNYDERNINYEILKNIEELSTNELILESLESINKEKDVYTKFKNIYDLYKEMIYKNEINMVYNISKQTKLKIFGKEFVENNEDTCKMIVNGKEQELKSEIFIKDNTKDKLKVKLTNINRINNMSFLFFGCSDLVSCNDMSKWNTSKIEDMHKIFYGCSTLTSLPDISCWKISKVKDICGMFYNCTNLSSIPDISEWDTSNVVNLSGLFCGCEKVKYLPDISRWNTNKVTDMNGIFCGCTSLEVVPNIEKWFTENVKDMSGLFCGCSNILKVPDISKWNVDKVKDLSGMFFSCSKILVIPDISNWNTENCKNMTGMFGNCVALTSLPDIAKWKLRKKVQILNMFEGCQENLEIPDQFRKPIKMRE